MDAVSLGKAGLSGWRAKVADGVAGPVARRAPLTDEQVRALVGVLFFALSLKYVVGTVQRLRDAASGGAEPLPGQHRRARLVTEVPADGRVVVR